MKTKDNADSVGHRNITYKIRQKSTGLFSSGGMFVKWTKKGKSWRAKNHLSCHINQSASFYRSKLKMDDIEVVEIVTEVVEVNIKEGNEVIANVLEERNRKQDLKIKKRNIARKQELESEIARLSRELNKV